MRVILATVGTRGDVQPLLALAQALLRQGHEAIVACPQRFAPWVRGHGIEQRDLGEDLQALLRSEGAASLGSLRGMTQYFHAQLALQAPRLLEIARGAHAIVGTGMAWMAPSVAEKLELAALVLVPSTCLRSRLHPPPLMPWYGLPRWVNALLWKVSDFAQNRLMREPLNAARAGLGLAPVRDFGAHLFFDIPCVLAADEAVLPPDPAWQGRYPYAGFLHFADPTPLDPALDAWLARGEPPVYVGFGSMAGGAPERVFELLSKTVAASPRRFLVAAGEADLPQLGAMPGPLFVVRDAPHVQLFPRVSAVVHHGGSGTMAAALRAGVPQVVLPLMLDQFHHAHHLVRAGLAPPVPSMAKVRPEQLTTAIEQAVTLPAAPRRAIAECLQQRDAGRAIVERLERAVKRTEDSRTRGRTGESLRVYGGADEIRTRV